MTPKHPIQPIVMAADGLLRFKANAAVRALLDWATPRGFGLNELHTADNITTDDHRQLAELIGYSLNGYAELSFISDDDYNTACQMHDAGLTEDKARIAVLEAELLALRSALREPIARLYGKHPDDLMEQS